MSVPGAIPSEDVGGFAMTVVSTEMSDAATHRWSRRSEWLATWLLTQWQEEQAHRTKDTLTATTTTEKLTMVVTNTSCGEASVADERNNV